MAFLETAAMVVLRIGTEADPYSFKTEADPYSLYTEADADSMKQKCAGTGEGRPLAK